MGWGGSRIKRRLAAVALGSGTLLLALAGPSGAHPANTGGNKPCGQNRNQQCPPPPPPPCADDTVSTTVGLLGGEDAGCQVDGVVDVVDQLPVCSSGVVQILNGILPPGHGLGCYNSGTTSAGSTLAPQAPSLP